MQNSLYMLAALLVLIGISTNHGRSSSDVYATTYLGNNWYVDQDSEASGRTVTLRCTQRVLMKAKYI